MSLKTREFKLAISEQIKKLPVEQHLPVLKKLTFDLFTRIVNKTPVDTGRARGNWQINIGTPLMNVLERFAKGGGETVTTEVSKLDAIKPFDNIWISNNLPYIEALENGHSRQAPSGMVELSVKEIESQFKAKGR